MRFHIKSTLIFAFLVFFLQPVGATVYSDAESGNDGWIVYDNKPAGASINVVNDSQIQSQVIQTQGYGRLNAYLLGGISSASGWDNSTETVLEWRMATAESFTIQVFIETAFGARRLIYNQSNSDLLKNPGNNSIHFGLGSAIVNGEWHEQQRDLISDVALGEPGNTLVAVNGFAVFASLRIDDVILRVDDFVPGQDLAPVARLSVTPSSMEAPVTITANAAASTDDVGIANYAFDFGDGSVTNGVAAGVDHTFTLAGEYVVSVTVTDTTGQESTTTQTVVVTDPVADPPTIYSDADDGTEGWVVFDNTPAGATIRAAFDATLQSQVISTLGAGRSNRYLLGGLTGTTGWNNRSQSVLSWDMSTDESFGVQIYVDTIRGIRVLNYTASNSDGLKNPSNNSISFGLGSATVGGGWIFQQRNLSDDVSRGEPGNNLLAVNGFMILGSLNVDNIALSGGAIEAPPASPTAVISASTTEGFAPLTINFNGTGSSAVGNARLTGYLWNFANGDTATSQLGSTTYTSEGVYNVSLAVTDSNNVSDVKTITITVKENNEPPVVNTGAEAASRLLAQATFGATIADIELVQQLGIQGWIDDQFTRQGLSQLSYLQFHPGSASLSGPRQHKWLFDAVEGDDQLRQRVAFALSQIFVTSDVGETLKREQEAMANYYDILLNNAFGNYRDLLEEITLNPVMGLYLSMIQNPKGDSTTGARADENYAREVMQLFSIGLHELNNNGTIRTDGNGLPRPAYTQADVEEYARIFTGWTNADAIRFDHPQAGANTNKFLQMEPFEGFHDFAEKQLLRGGVSPAGLSEQDDLKNALDSIFNHPNVGPFFGTQLIKRLVTSNPTPAYIARVANTFNDNGSGVRGDLLAVTRAILIDPEARNGHLDVPNFGKLREPLLRWTHLWRAFNAQRGTDSTFNQFNHGSPDIQLGGQFLGQGVLSAPSVFNFYFPDYAPLGVIRESNLVAPEAEIYTDAYILTTTEKLTALTQNFNSAGNDNSRRNSYIDISAETDLAANTEALLDHLDLLLLSGQMNQQMRVVMLDHLNALPADEPGRVQRVLDGITLIMASPQYLVQK